MPNALLKGPSVSWYTPTPPRTAVRAVAGDVPREAEARREVLERRVLGEQAPAVNARR